MLYARRWWEPAYAVEGTVEELQTGIPVCCGDVGVTGMTATSRQVLEALHRGSKTKEWESAKC